MGRDIEDIIKGLPEARRSRINARAEKLAEEMMSEASSLAAIRKVAGLTQTQLGELMGVNQNAVSQLEKRTELFFSTVRNVAVALGYELEVAFRKPDGKRVPLPNFRPWEDTSASSGSAHRNEAAASGKPASDRRARGTEAPSPTTRIVAARDGKRTLDSKKPKAARA